MCSDMKAQRDLQLYDTEQQIKTLTFKLEEAQDRKKGLLAIHKKEVDDNAPVTMKAINEVTVSVVKWCSFFMIISMFVVLIFINYMYNDNIHLFNLVVFLIVVFAMGYGYLDLRERQRLMNKNIIYGYSIIHDIAKYHNIRVQYWTDVERF